MVTDRRGGRQTMVISRSSVIHPHNLPALLESEGDERERKGERGESRRGKKRERERRGRQKYTNELIGS